MLLVTLMPVTATAQTESSAYAGESFSSVMQEGIRLYNEGKTDASRYQDALNAFLYAHQLEPDQAIVTYNIARTYHRLGNCEKALNHYLLYQSIAIADSDYTDVSEYIAALTKQCGMTGTLVLHCSPSQAEVSFDGERAVLCDGMHTLKAGKHRYSVRAKGYASIEQDINIDINSVATSTVALQHSDSTTFLINRPSLWEDPIFVSGFAAASVGALASITGGILLACGYDKQSIENSTRYDRDDGLITGGAVTLALGGAALGAGIGLLIHYAISTHKTDDERIQQYRNTLSFDPVIHLSSDGASAGIQFIF